MKFRQVLPVAAMVVAPLGHAQSEQMKGMDMQDHHGASTSQATQHRAAGVIKSVDSAKGTVLIAHGPIESLKWPPMTMKFTLKDKSMAGSVKPGAKVEFTFVQSGKDYLITQLRQ